MISGKVLQNPKDLKVISDPLTLGKLKVFSFAASLLEPYLTKYQGDGLMLPFEYLTKYQGDGPVTICKWRCQKVVQRSACTDY